MIRLGKLSPITFLTLLLAVAPTARAATNATPDFKEVYESLRAHLAGVDEAELNRAAVAGLLKELGPKAALTSVSTATNAAATPRISKSSLFEGDLAYLRLARVDDGLAAALRDAYQSLAASNKLAGVVLDLRFADGADYAASVAAAELFSSKKTATLDWGQGVRETKAGNEVVSAPLVILVNGQTRAAAETLAALLHETGAGLLLGNPTAGHALLTQDFPLSHGATLRVATASVKLNGAELSPVQPDIAVTVSAEDEQRKFAEASLVSSSTNPPTLAGKPAGTNAPNHRVRLTEATLVRAHKQGLNLGEDEAGFVSQAHENKLETPVVKDPALARALDLLRGLAIVRPARP